MPGHLTNDPLLRMALQLARDDTPAARTLLTELAERQPARSEARAALLTIGAAPR